MTIWAQHWPLFCGILAAIGSVVAVAGLFCWKHRPYRCGDNQSNRAF